MDDHESPLLSKESSSSSSSSSVVASSFKWILKVLMSVMFVAWVVFLFVYPGKLGDGILTNWRAVSSHTLFGTTGFTFLLIFRQKSFKIVTNIHFHPPNLQKIFAGSMFLIFSGPILVISVLASLYLIISGEENVFTKYVWSTFITLV